MNALDSLKLGSKRHTSSWRTLASQTLLTCYVTPTAAKGPRPSEIRPPLRMCTRRLLPPHPPLPQPR